MKNAKELFEISSQRLPARVNEVLNGVVEHIEERCEDEAMKGNFYYTIYLNKIERFCEDLLLEKCVEIAKHFEKSECKVSIDNGGNGYWLNYNITVSWDGEIHGYHRGFGHDKHLYDTDNGLLNRKAD